MDFVKKWKFLPCVFFFVGRSSQNRSFFNILDREERFFDQKSDVTKKSKKSKFSKGVGL